MFNDLEQNKQNLLKKNCPPFEIFDLEKNNEEIDGKRFIKIPFGSIMIWEKKEKEKGGNYFIDQKDRPQFENENYFYKILFYKQKTNCNYFENNRKIMAPIYIPQLVLISKNSIIQTDNVIQSIKLFNMKDKETHKYNLQILKKSEVVLDDIEYPSNESNGDWAVF